MFRRALFVLAMACALPALAQDYSGTYAASNAQGARVTLILSQDAQSRVTGSLEGNGGSLSITGEASAEGVIGTVNASGEDIYFLAEPEGGASPQANGAKLHVVLAEPGPDGLPNLKTARQLVFARVAAGRSAAPARAPAPPGDGLAEFLMSNPWCAFSYNQASGTTRRERVEFLRDGVLVSQSGAETYSSGYGGSVAGEYRGATRARWRVAGNELHLSEDGATWAPQQLRIGRNSSGSAIIKSGGKEYMVCR